LFTDTLDLNIQDMKTKIKLIIANILMAVPAVMALAFRVYWTFMGR
jgi:hypothetical protein